MKKNQFSDQVSRVFVFMDIEHLKNTLIKISRIFNDQLYIAWKAENLQGNLQIFISKTMKTLITENLNLSLKGFTMTEKNNINGKNITVILNNSLMVILTLIF